MATTKVRKAPAARRVLPCYCGHAKTNHYNAGGKVCKDIYCSCPYYFADDRQVAK